MSHTILGCAHRFQCFVIQQPLRNTDRNNVLLAYGFLISSISRVHHVFNNLIVLQDESLYTHIFR